MSLAAISGAVIPAGDSISSPADRSNCTRIVRIIIFPDLRGCAASRSCRRRSRPYHNVGPRDGTHLLLAKGENALAISHKLPVQVSRSLWSVVTEINEARHGGMER
jgi:hypothetical protein